MLVIAASFMESPEAYIFLGRLKAEGIPAYIAHEFHVGNNWAYATALGGVKVQVPADRLGEARHVERLSGAGEFRALLEAEFGDLNEIHCRKCGSADYRRLRPIPRQLLAIVASFLTGTVFPAWGWIHVCNACRTRFKP
jgi:hypothetical protein